MRTIARSRSPLSLVAAMAALVGSASVSTYAGDAYTFTVNQPNSSVLYNISVSAPFSGSMTGENNPTKPAIEQTRMKRATQVICLFPSCGTFTATTNDVVNVSGALTTSGSNTASNPARPDGTFQLDINTTTGVARLRGLRTNLLASGAISLTVNLSNFDYVGPFCTVNPSCSVGDCGAITLPLGNGTLSDLIATQAPTDVAVGTLTAGSSAGQWNFSIPVTVTVTTALALNGAPFPSTPQLLPIVFAGTVTVAPTSASMTGSTTVDINPPADTTPTVQPPQAFTIPTGSPLCVGANILLSLTTNPAGSAGTTIRTTGNASYAAAGPKVACDCDIDASDTRDVADIFAYLSLFFANNTRADFDRNGTIEVADIFAFLSCWFGGTGFGC